MTFCYQWRSWGYHSVIVGVIIITRWDYHSVIVGVIIIRGEASRPHLTRMCSSLPHRRDLFVRLNFVQPDSQSSFSGERKRLVKSRERRKMKDKSRRTNGDRGKMRDDVGNALQNEACSNRAIKIGSMIVNRPPNNEKLVGTEMEVKFLQADKEERRIICSNRTAALLSMNFPGQGASLQHSTTV